MKLCFGIELEISGLRYTQGMDIVDSLQSHRINLHGDSSIKPFGCEIVMGVYSTEFAYWPNGQGLQHFIRDFKRIKAALPPEARVNSSCGGHIHVSCPESSVDITNSMLTVWANKSVLYAQRYYWQSRAYYVRSIATDALHYARVNIRDRNHLEFREFNGTLNLRAVLRNIHRAMTMYNEIIAVTTPIEEK